MKQLIVITMMAFAILSLKAQNESSMPSISSMPSSASPASPASYFNHLDLSVSLGTSGIGFDLATIGWRAVSTVWQRR